MDESNLPFGINAAALEAGPEVLAALERTAAKDPNPLQTELAHLIEKDRLPEALGLVTPLNEAQLQGMDLKLLHHTAAKFAEIGEEIRVEGPYYDDVLIIMHEYNDQAKRLINFVSENYKNNTPLSGGFSTTAKQGVGFVLRSASDGEDESGRRVPAKAGLLGEKFASLNVVDRKFSGGVKTAAVAALTVSGVADIQQGDIGEGAAQLGAAGGIVAVNTAAGRDVILKTGAQFIPEEAALAVKALPVIKTIAKNGPVIGGYVTGAIVAGEVGLALSEGEIGKAFTTGVAGAAETTCAFFAGGLGANICREPVVLAIKNIGPYFGVSEETLAIRHSDAVEVGMLAKEVATSEKPAQVAQLFTGEAHAGETAHGLPDATLTPTKNVSGLILGD